MTVILSVQLLNENAKLPTRGSLGAAGFDLYACLDEPLLLKAGDRTVIPTGIAMTIPSGHYGRVAPRSGLAVKHGLDVGAGVVDEDYFSEVGVVLFNLGKEDYIVNHKDRVAQMIITPYATPSILQVDNLNPTERKGGFGSTGK